MKQALKRGLLLVIVVILCLNMVPPVGAWAAEDAMSTEDIKALLNSVELHPQRTGYTEFDRLLAQILEPYKDSDNYTKIKAMYEWTVKNVSYSWEGYTKQTAPAYEYFAIKYTLNYETGLPEAIPVEVINRSYHSLTAKKGVCYDYAALFAVMARYVGIEAYVHTGYFSFEPWAGSAYAGTTGHHGWTELKIDGKNYIFDPQRDCVYLRVYGACDAYFGIAPEKAWRYEPEKEVNAARDAGFLPVDAPRLRTVKVSTVASRSGTVAGGGAYYEGTQVTLTSAGALPVVGWYTPGGELLAEGPSYTFTATGDTTVYAMFEGDYFFDISSTAWYAKDASEAAARGIVAGTSPTTFDGAKTLTRAMVVSFLARVEGAGSSAASSPFTDLRPGAYYVTAVNWAWENNVVYGVTGTQFAPEANVTREQLAAMIVRYLAAQGITADAAPLSYQDAGRISNYAKEPMGQAQALGIIAGYEDNTVRPRNAVTRAEGVAMIMRMVRCMEAAGIAAAA